MIFIPNDSHSSTCTYLLLPPSQTARYQNHEKYFMSSSSFHQNQSSCFHFFWLFLSIIQYVVVLVPLPPKLLQHLVMEIYINLDAAHFEIEIIYLHFFLVNDFTWCRKTRPKYFILFYLQSKPRKTKSTFYTEFVAQNVNLHRKQ